MTSSQLCRQLRREEIIADLRQHALQTDGLEELLRAAVDAVHGALDAEYSEVLERIPGDDLVRRRASVGPDGSLGEPATVSLGQGTESGAGFPMDGSIVADGRNAESESTDNDGTDRTEIVSEISATGESWGILGVYTTDQSGFDAEAVAFVDRVAAVLGTAIESSRERAGAIEHHRASTEAFFSIDERWRFVHVNEHAAEFFDRDAETLRGEVVWAVVPEGSVLANRFREAMATREQATVEQYIDTIDRYGEFIVSPSGTGLAVCIQDVTDRGERERQLSTLIENVPGMVYRCRNERGWPMEFVSDGSVDVTGYEPNAFVDGEVTYGSDVVAADDRDDLWESIQETVTDRDPFSETYCIKTADGERRWVRDYGRGIFDEDGDLVGLEGIIADVTERKRLEIELEELLGRVTDAFYALDDQWRFTHVNERAAELLRHSEEELLGEELWELFPEAAGNEEVWTAFHEAMETQEPRSYDLYFDPLEFWVEATVYPSETGVSVYFRDVTEQRERQQKLKQYRSLTEAATDVIVTIDAESTIQSVNPAVEDIFGYETEALVGESLTTLMDDEHATRHCQALDRYLRIGERNLDWNYVEVSGQHADGSSVPLSITFNEVVYEGERYFTGVIRDVSEREERESELRRKERRYEAVFEDPNILVGLLEPDGTVVDVNETAMEYVDANLADVAGERFWETPWWGESDDVRAEVREWTERASEGEYVDFEADLTRPDGQPYTLSGYFRPVTNDEGEVVSIIVSDRDITARKQRERELTESERRYRALVENFPNGAVALVDENLCYQTVGGMSEVTAGTPPEGIIGKSVETAVPADLAAELVPRYEAAIKDGETATFEQEHGDRIFQFRIVPVRDDNDEVFAALGMSQDVTPQRTYARRLEESEQRYRTLVEYFPNGLVTLFDHDLEYTLAAGQGFEKVSIDPETAEGEHFADVWGEAAAETLRPVFETVLAGEEETVELSYEGREWVLRGVPITDERGDVFAGMTMAQDITERKAYERTLQSLNESARELLSAETGSAVSQTVVNTAALVLSLPCVACYRYDDDRDVLFPDAHTTTASFPVDDVPELPADGDSWTARAFRSGETRHFGEVTEPDDVAVTAEDDEMRAGVAVPIGPHGVVVAGAGTPDAIGDRHRTQLGILATNARAAYDRVEREREFKETRDRLEAATEAGAVGTWDWDPRTDELVVGEGFAKTFGVDPMAAREGVSLDQFLESIHEADRERVETKIEEALESDDRYEAEYRVHDADGDLRWVVARGRVERDEHGKPVSFPGALTDITERKRAELELQRNKEQLETLFDILPVGVLVAEPNGKLVQANDTAREIWGGMTFDAESVDEYDQYPIYNTQTGERIDPAQITFARVLRGEEVIEPDVYEIETADGERRIVESQARPVRCEDGEVTRGVTTFADVTEQHEYRRRLEESERRYRTLVEHFPSGAVGLFDEELEYITVGGELIEEGDRTAEDLVGSSVYDLYPEELLEEIEPHFRAAIRGETATFEAEYRDRHLAAHTLPIHDADGTVFAGMLVVQDVTEQREQERQLRKREQHLERYREYTDDVLDAIDDVFYILDKSGGLQRWNESLASVTGYDDEEIAAMNAIEFFDERHHDRIAEAIRTGFESGYTQVEASLLTTDGEEAPYEFVASPLEDPDGKTVLAGIGRDITERRERRRQLEQSEQRYRTLAEHFPNGAVGIYDHDLRYTLAEGAKLGEELPSEETLEGNRMPEIFPDYVVDDLEPVFRAAVEDGEIDSTAIEFSGRHWRLWAAPLRDADDDVFAGLSFMQDVTEQIQRQERLEELVDRLEESNERLEQFAYAASHDLQEPLRMVSSYLQLIERRYGDALDEDGEEFLEFAVDGADRMSDMIEGLLQYSRVETRGDPFEPVDLEGVLGEVCEDLILSIQESGAEIETEELPTVRGDRSQLRQVFQNLLDNAIEYSKDDSPRVEISAERDGSEWLISVQDNGIGIAPDDTERVFEVFQRLHTQADHGGTGIGLALVERIVERHGGRIWVESEPGEGSTFSFTLAHNGETNE